MLKGRRCLHPGWTWAGLCPKTGSSSIQAVPEPGCARRQAVCASIETLPSFLELGGRAGLSMGERIDITLEISSGRESLNEVFKGVVGERPTRRLRRLRRCARRIRKKGGACCWYVGVCRLSRQCSLSSSPLFKGLIANGAGVRAALQHRSADGADYSGAARTKWFVRQKTDSNR